MEMKKFLQKKLKNEKGMTLIELLAVIVILAIIAAIAIPAIGNIIENSRVGAVKSDYVNAIAAAELYALDNPTDDDVTMDDIRGTAAGSEIYLDDKGSITAFAYVPSTNKVTGSATRGNIVIATVGATKQDISSIANNAVTGTNVGGATLTRN